MLKRSLAYVLLFACVVLMNSPLVVAENKSQKITLPSLAKVGSSQVPAGDYDLSWTGTAPDVQITLTKNKKVVATAPARLVVEMNKLGGVETYSRDGVDAVKVIRTKTDTFWFDSVSTPSQ